METIDHLLITAAVIFFFGAVSLARLIWSNMQRYLMYSAPKPNQRVLTVEAGTQTPFNPLWLPHENIRMHTTHQGDKIHIYEDCQHLRNRVTLRRNGFCEACWERMSRVEMD